MQEEWRDIIGFDGRYQVSNLGNVRSTDRLYKQSNAKTDEYNHIYKGKMLKPHYTIWGYKRVGLSKNGKVKYFTIHKLVAEAFLKNNNNYPCVNHIDGNKENNNVSNLEWCTYSRNNRHAREIGLNKGISYKTRCKKAIEYNYKLQERYCHSALYDELVASKIYEISEKNIKLLNGDDEE